MGTLYLVRHGQASFGAAQYDQLSPLGERQCERLGRYWAERGLRFDAVLRGSLQRHAQTWDAIARGAGWAQSPLEWPGLNEYDSHALLTALAPGMPTAALGDPTTPDGYRAHFRRLREALAQWMAGSLHPVGMPSYSGFVHGVTSALDHVRRAHAGQSVLIVSSGGPIATAVGQVLGLGPDAIIELNLRIRNSAVTEFVFNPRRHSLLSYNTLPHLDHPDCAGWVTYA